MDKKEQDKILNQAHKHYAVLFDANQDNKDNFIADMKFAFNLEEGHWDSNDISSRDSAGRPHLTSNKMSKFVAQVVNQERTEANFGDVIPVDDKSDVEGALVRNDLIEDIEYQSNIDEIYCESGEHAVGGGFGYWRIITEYTDEGFDQEIKIKLCPNPLLVDLDPKGNYAFIREVYSEEEFKREFPDVDDKFNRDSFDTEYDETYWYKDDQIFVAEYFVKEPYTRKLAEIANPTTGESQVVELTKENEKAVRKNSVVLRERDAKSYKIMWYKLTGSSVLEKREWAGKYIPIVEVDGHLIRLNGKEHKLSLIRDAKDNNRIYNYWLTAMTEKVALSPKSPFLVTPEQIKGFEEQWRTANLTNSTYLLYNHTVEGKPQREPSPPIDSGAMNLLSIANSDIKDVLGMYESALGQQSNERSGKAITARNARSDLVTYTFPDNLRKAKVKTKKILLDLIPKIYDNERVVRLRGKDTIVPLNQKQLIDGREVIVNDLSKGRYDFRVKQNSSPSRRQQISENIIQAMQYAPAYADIMLMLLMKYMDAPGADEILQAIQQRNTQIQQAGQVPGGQNPTEIPNGGF